MPNNNTSIDLQTLSSKEIIESERVHSFKASSFEKIALQVKLCMGTSKIILCSLEPQIL